VVGFRETDEDNNEDSDDDDDDSREEEDTHLALEQQWTLEAGQQAASVPE
jgi:hypothetical protein